MDHYVRLPVNVTRRSFLGVRCDRRADTFGTLREFRILVCPRLSYWGVPGGRAPLYETIPSQAQLDLTVTWRNRPGRPVRGRSSSNPAVAAQKVHGRPLDSRLPIRDCNSFVPSVTASSCVAV